MRNSFRIGTILICYSMLLLCLVLIYLKNQNISGWEGVYWFILSLAGAGGSYFIEILIFNNSNNSNSDQGFSK